MQLSMTSGSAEHASKAPRQLPRHRHSCSSALVSPAVSLARKSPSSPPLGGAARWLSRASYRGSLFFLVLVLLLMPPWMPDLAYQFRASLSPHSAKPSCLPQFMTVKPTSSNSCFPFSVFLLQNCSGENAMTLTYRLPNSNNYLCAIKPLWSVTHPPGPHFILQQTPGIISPHL